MTFPKMLTPEEVAKVLRVSTETLKSYRRKKIGPKWLNLNTEFGTVRYLEDDLEAYQMEQAGR